MWLIVFTHLLGNPVYSTAEPEFSTLEACRARVEQLDRRHRMTSNWRHACVRKE
jgi:hypothetical protein